jgi:hypothetical protein
MCDSHYNSRKEILPTPPYQNYKKNAPKIHKKKSYGIHKQITREQEDELQPFHIYIMRKDSLQRG